MNPIREWVGDQVVVKLNNNNNKIALIIFPNNMSLYVCIIDINKGSYCVMLAIN